MTYPFTSLEKTQIQALITDNDTVGIYKFVLFHTSNFTSSVASYTDVTHSLMEDATPITGVDKSVWLWARGAYGVNDPQENNYFSDFIRNYTIEQHKLRYGSEPGPNEIEIELLYSYVSKDSFSIPLQNDQIVFDYRIKNHKTQHNKVDKGIQVKKFTTYNLEKDSPAISKYLSRSFFF